MFLRRKFQRFYTPQVDERDCGVAALNMVLKYYGSNYSLATLRNIAKTDREGTTALGLVKAAEQLKLKVHPIRAGKDLLNVKDIPFPFIAHVVKQSNIQHYYVVFDIEKDYVIIGDPDPQVKVVRLPKETFLNEWTGVSLFFAPLPEYIPQVEDKGKLTQFIPLLVHQRKLIANIVIASLLITLISIAGTYFLQLIIDSYIPMALMSTLSIVSLGLIMAYIFQGVFTYSQNFLLAILGQRLTIEVTLSYIRHLFKLPMSFFSTRRTGEIVSRFNDASKIIDALGSTIITMFLDVWIVVAVGVILGLQNASLFLISLVAIPFYAIIVLVFKKPFERLNQDAMESNAVVSSSIIEDVNGIETIKALTSEKESYEKVDHEFSNLLKKTFAYKNADYLQQALKLTLKLVLNVIVLWVGANLVMQNKMTLGQLFTYNALLSYFTEPLENIINLQPKLQMAKVANNRLNEVFLVPSEFTGHRIVNKVEMITGDIEVEKVDFKYGYGNSTLSDVSLKIKQNEKLTIVGMSGSGKTTLAKLLVGFYPVDRGHGKIRFHSNDIKDIDLHVLRRYITYVPQDPVIFSGTILENLTQGSIKNLTQEELLKACSIAQIKEEILKMPLQFSTELTETGEILSGGQRQRLAIARALLSSASVLVFDESTSNLDTITERRIVEELIQIKNKTIIFVAHRLTIAKKTDNVIVMNEGHIVERGTHADLIKKDGYYSVLVHE